MKVNVNGEQVDGEQISFTPISEPFAEYHLEDGNVVRIKLVLLRIVKTDRKNLDGTPLYAFTQNIVSAVDEK